MALTVASPDIGLQLRQQQQGTIGHAYLPPQQNQQLNQQYYEQQQQTFTVHHNGNPAQLTSNNPEDVFIKYDTQQEADKNCKFNNNMIDNKF